jgi:putative OPT family oligopeptide transporter
VPEFQPFVPASENPPEFTFRAILLGSFFGIIFGAVTVYVGLRAGLTVAASIPIAVLSISILRAFGRSSILENVIVQTTGNAGQSIAAGVIFTLPALIFLGFDLEYARIFMLALIGGFLGVLFMVPLRKQLIVDEHENLKFPEGTACADVLIAGEKGGALASRVFFGLGLGGIYTFFQNENLFGAWPGTPEFRPDFGPNHVLKGASIKADATSEYLGVGYIIGPKTAGVMLAGGVLSWLVLMPLIYFFGKELAHPLYPGTVPVGQMTPSDLWITYIRPMGAGAVAAAGLITLVKTLPTIVAALGAGFKHMRGGNAAATAKPLRTERDFSMGTAVVGSAVLLPIFEAGAGRQPGTDREPGGIAADRLLRLPVCDRQFADCGPDWQLGQPHLRHDHRHAHGHLRHLPGERMGHARLWRAGHHHRRRGVHCLG